MVVVEVIGLLVVVEVVVEVIVGLLVDEVVIGLLVVEVVVGLVVVEVVGGLFVVEVVVESGLGGFEVGFSGEEPPGFGTGNSGILSSWNTDLIAFINGYRPFPQSPLKSSVSIDQTIPPPNLIAFAY